LYLFPTEDAAVVVLANTGNEEVVSEVADHLAEVVVPKYAETLKAQSTNEGKLPTFVPPPELIGQWSGDIKTWDGSVPVLLTVKADGDIHVKLGEEPEAMLTGIRFSDGNLIGRFAGTIPTKDASRYPHTVLLNLRLRERNLSGQATAQSSEEPSHFGLTSYLVVKKSVAPVNGAK